MATKERLAGEQILRDAERVLRDVKELSRQKQLTRDCAITVGRLKSHLEPAQEILAKGVNLSNKMWFNLHVHSIKSLTDQYWRERGQHT